MSMKVIFRAILVLMKARGAESEPPIRASRIRKHEHESMEGDGVFACL